MSLLSPPDDLDWSQEQAVSRWLDQHPPDVIVNTCGWSDDGRLAAVDSLLTPCQVIASQCHSRNLVLLQLSNYRVFSGKKSGFTESDQTVPRDEVGELYLQVERAVAEVPRHIILRLSWVIGWRGVNLLTKIMQPLLAGGRAEIVRERRGSPVSHLDIGRVINAVLKQISCGAENWGVFHYGAADVCTEDEFAAQIVKRLSEKTVISGEVVDVSAGATEPLSASLGYRRLMDCFGVQPRTWKQGLTQELSLWSSNNPMPADQINS